MEEKLKKSKSLVFILLAILLALIAFGGIYVRNYGNWENAVPNFKTGMELNGFREVRFALDDTEEEKNVYVDDQGKVVGVVPQKEVSTQVPEEGKENNSEEKKEDLPYKKELRKIKVNSDEAINIDNFNKTKEIIQKRLEQLDEYEYNIRMDNVTGEIILELPDDKQLETQTQLVVESGKLEIVDAETGIVLLDNSNLKSAKLLVGPVGQDPNMNTLFLQLAFDKEGKEKISNMSETYVKSLDEKGQEKIKEITIKLDGIDLVTTSFASKIEDGVLSISVGKPTSDYNEITETALQLKPVEIVLSNGPLPLVYKITADNFIESSFSSTAKLIINIIFIVAILGISIYLIVKYKGKGLKAAIYAIAYAAILILILKYTRVTMTLNSVIALLIIIVVNYIFVIKLLNKLKNDMDRRDAFAESIKELFLAIVPLCIVAIIFTFMSSVVINSIGMVLFWGLILLVLYNLLIVYALDLI